MSMYISMDLTTKVSLNTKLDRSVSIINYGHLAFAKGDATAIILVLLAAFETIYNATLWEHQGSWFCRGGSALLWFKSYLTD